MGVLMVYIFVGQERKHISIIKIAKGKAEVQSSVKREGRASKLRLK